MLLMSKSFAEELQIVSHLDYETQKEYRQKAEASRLEVLSVREEMEEALETQKWQLEAQHDLSVELLEKSHERDMDFLKASHKKEMAGVQKELEQVKQKLIDALNFAKESCQALGTMLNYRNRDYYVDHLSYRQESLIETIRELGAKLVRDCGYGKAADEIEQLDGVTKRLEERIDDKTYAKSYDRGGMTL